MALISKPSAVTKGDAPIACTLGADSLGGRLDDWRQVLAHASARTHIDDGVRVEFSPDVPIAELSRLVVAEHECCQFFRFAISVDGRGLALEVTAPARRKRSSTPCSVGRQ